MDHPPQLEQTEENPGHNLTATDTRTETTVKITHESGIQTTLKDSEKIEKIQSERYASVSTSQRTVNINESKFTRRHGHDNICVSVNSQGSNISSLLEASRDASVSDISNYRKKTDNNQTAESRRHGQDNICGSVNSPGSNVSLLRASRDASVSDLSNYRRTDNNPAHKRSKSKMCNKRGKDLPTHSKQKDINYDKSMDINTSETPLDLRVFGSINRKTQTIEPSPSDNHENPIRKNILLAPGQNIASNISVTKISQNNIAPSEISDSESKRKSVWFVDSILSDPGPSGLRTINNPKQLCRQPCNQSETPSVNCEEKKGFTCRVCKAEIAKHATENNVFSCCVCLFKNCKEAILHMHSYTHVPKRICNVCGKKHADGNLHDSEHTCVVCQEKFQCRTRLYEHFLCHRDYFNHYCWVCNRRFSLHLIEEDGCSSLLCCVCGSTSTKPSNLAIHHVLHLPKLFCKLCKEEYLQEEKSFHDRKCKCIECSKEFGCITELEDHYKEHDAHFSKHCRLCNELINEHYITHEGTYFLQCCHDKCPSRFGAEHTFQNHLYSHGLRAFKCDKCGRRFQLNGRLLNHSVICKALSYKCDICETRFHSIDYLHAHCLVKHSQS